MQVDDLVFSWSLHSPETKRPELIDAERCIRILLDFERTHSLTPTDISLRGEGYTVGTVEFEAGLEELKRNHFTNLESISITTATPDSDDLAFYWKVKFLLHCSSILGAQCYVGVKAAHAALRDDVFEQAVQPICQVFKPAVGYAYLMNAEDGPVAYSRGAVHTPNYDRLSPAKKELSYTWARNMSQVSSGKLRDLYQFNIVSEAHLQRPIDGDGLEHWIASDTATRGVLTRLSDRDALWTVPAASYHQIRDKLAANDMLIAYDEHVVPTQFLS